MRDATARTRAAYACRLRRARRACFEKGSSARRGAAVLGADQTPPRHTTIARPSPARRRGRTYAAMARPSHTVRVAALCHRRDVASRGARHTFRHVARPSLPSRVSTVWRWIAPTQRRNALVVSNSSRPAPRRRLRGAAALAGSYASPRRTAEVAVASASSAHERPRGLPDHPRNDFFIEFDDQSAAASCYTARSPRTQESAHSGRSCHLRAASELATVGVDRRSRRL